MPAKTFVFDRFSIDNIKSATSTAFQRTQDNTADKRNRIRTTKNLGMINRLTRVDDEGRTSSYPGKAKKGIIGS